MKFKYHCILVIITDYQNSITVSKTIKYKMKTFKTIINSIIF